MPSTSISPAATQPTMAQADAWRSFLHAHARITRAIEDELLAGQQLTLAGFDVLVQLAEAPGRRMRMTELAEAMLLSRSGITRLVDRMERAGLVRRERVDGDGRGVVAALTAEGARRLGGASQAHAAGIARHFAAVLDDEEFAQLGRICARLAEWPGMRLVGQRDGTDG